MKNDDVRDAFVWGPAILVIIALCVLLTCLGCRSVCPPAEVRIVEVEVPVYACPSPPTVDPMTLPLYPEDPPEGSLDDVVKEWYAEMVSVAKARYKILLARIQALEEILDQYRGD